MCSVQQGTGGHFHQMDSRIFQQMVQFKDYYPLVRKSILFWQVSDEVNQIYVRQTATVTKPYWYTSPIFYNVVNWKPILCWSVNLQSIWVVAEHVEIKGVGILDAYKVGRCCWWWCRVTMCPINTVWSVAIGSATISTLISCSFQIDEFGEWRTLAADYVVRSKGHPLNTAPSTQRSSTRLVTGPVEIDVNMTKRRLNGKQGVGTPWIRACEY
jgi:hypothetical protein